ncbi:MAG: hypothetical protein GY777_00010 [Candidatus Brocadiaceae bacterium]|nr:hypothetical protein [Candidatus Brocadiaceae bacterium]
MIRVKQLIIFLPSLLLLQPAQSEELEVDCSVSSVTYTGTLFREIYDSGQDAATQLCKGLLSKSLFDSESNKDFQFSLAGYAHKTEGAIERLELDKIVVQADLERQVAAMVNTLESFSTHGRFPLFISEPNMGTPGSQGYFEPVKVETQISEFQIPKTHPKCELLLPGQGCKAVFDELSEAFNAYREPYEQYTSNRNAVLIDELSKNWDHFLEVSKSQTALEVFLTTWFQSGHFKKDYLVGPPKYQIIALHPQLVYENLGEASGGERGKTGIALEWFGVNFWNSKLPIGVSLARVFVDRTSGNPYADGVMLHFDNQYSIGFTDHDEGTGVFVTVDLLKLIENKKSNLDQYLDSLK